MLLAIIRSVSDGQCQVNWESWQFRFTEFCASFRAVDGAVSSDEGKPETILHGESAFKGSGLRPSSGRSGRHLGQSRALNAR
jgi:hypothetical protein